MSRVIVIGGGLAGVATAYELIRRGYDTTLLERQPDVALETSHANGGLLTPSMADPWNSPGVHWRLASSLFDKGSAMKLRLHAVPSLVGWGVMFLRHATAARHELATVANFLLARYSVERTRELRSRLSLRYDASTLGTMKVFRSGAAMAEATAVAKRLVPLGLVFEELDCDGAIRAEPALAGIRAGLAGALRFREDESGDARQFCEQLAAAFVRAGGVARTSSCVSGILVERGSVTGLRIGDQIERADMVVVAAGNSSSNLVRRLGVRLPIRPAKGYTVTFDAAHVERPEIPIVDDAFHAAIVPIGTRLRVAGTAEFAGNDMRIRQDRIDNLMNLLSGVLPDAARQIDRSTARSWAGLRPMSADGLPFIGPTHVKGLYVNTGHGHLGWTLAAGSARLLADLVAGSPAELDPGPYSATRC